MQNLEQKAFCGDVNGVRRRLRDLGAQLRYQAHQVDTYFETAIGRFKLREDDGVPQSLIGYQRADEGGDRISDYEKVSVAGQEKIINILKRFLKVTARVMKQRESYAIGDVIVNVDSVARLGNFIEIEVPIPSERGDAAARRVADTLAAKLHIRSADQVPWSYANMINMLERSVEWHDKLKEAKGPNYRGLVLIDGASAVGKSTIKNALLSDQRLVFDFVRRKTTRKERPGDAESGDYEFVSGAQFRRMANMGEFLEYRDFKFGMSYGLAWWDAISPQIRGRNCLALINLGSGRFVKHLWPEALTILVTAADEVVHQRLRSRGFMTEEQIEERLENNRIARELAVNYDCVVDNTSRPLDSVVFDIREVVRRHLGNA